LYFFLGLVSAYVCAWTRTCVIPHFFTCLGVERLCVLLRVYITPRTFVWYPIFDKFWGSTPRANGTKTHVPSTSSSSDFLNADRGDLFIRGFSEGSTDTIIDVRVTNLDSKSYKNLQPKKALERQEKEKKKILQTLWEPTSPFYTLRGIDGRNVRLWSPSILTVRGFIITRMSIALVRATHCCIRGSRGISAIVSILAW